MRRVRDHTHGQSVDVWQHPRAEACGEEALDHTQDRFRDLYSLHICVCLKGQLNAKDAG
ncbi:hypothetical protein D3C86_1493860 [compost metagenome]